MTTLVRWDGIGIAEGTTLTAGSVGAGDIGSPVLFSGPSVGLTKRTDTDPVFADCVQKTLETVGRGFRFPFAAQGAFRVRFYFKKDSTLNGNAIQFSGLTDGTGGNYLTRFAISGSGDPWRARFYETTTHRQSALNAIVGNAWYRYEAAVRLDPDSTGVVGNSTYEWWVYRHSDHALVHSSGLVTGVNLGWLTADGFRFGLVAGTTDTGTLHLAHFEVTDTPDVAIGPWSDTPPPDTILGTWDTATNSVVPTEVLGTWDGTVIEPVEVLGTWDAGTATIQPLEGSA